MPQFDSPNSGDRAQHSHARAASDNSVLHMIWRERRLVIWSAAACVVLSFVYLLFASRVYTATARLLVQHAEPIVMNTQRMSDESADENFLSTQCQLIRAAPILSAVAGLPEADEMRTFDGVKNRMSLLKRYMSADVGKKDDIITVSFESKYPDEAVKIVDAAVDAYQKYCSSKKRETANEVLAILEKQKTKNQGELAAINTKIIELKRGANTISFGNDKGNYTLQRLQSLSDALTAAHMETINARSAFESAAKIIGSDADSIPDNISGGIALAPKDEETLRAQLVSLQQMLLERKRIYLPDHPQIKSIQSRINELNMAYIGAAKVRWEQAKTREVELQKSYEQEQRNAINISSKATEAQQLEADAKRLQDVIDGLETRIKDVSVVVDSGALNITVLETASYEDNPVKPSKAQVPLIAMVLGVIIGCGLAIGREMSDPRLHGADDVKSLTQAPLLGLVPRQVPAGTPSVLGQIVELDPHNDVSEAMRAVRTSLTFGVAPENARSIVVTSPEPGDGKSTIAANLSIALANAGKRVLLIDGDLRNPSLHQIFGVSNDNGFSTILTNRELQASLIRPCKTTRLSLLTGGPAPMSPSELLNDPCFGELLAEFYKSYDHVVIDSPPVTRVDDARVMAATCDCTILVGRAEKTSHSLLKMSVDRLMDVGAFIGGVVLNAAQAGSRYGRYGRYGAAGDPTPGQTRSLATNQQKEPEKAEFRAN
jgi:capsular exopolysaccharide synthesis family protein